MKKIAVFALLVFLSFQAFTQFTGPRGAGREITVERAQAARIGAYVTLVGYIVENIHEDYYTFRDTTGRIRIQVETEVWQGREITPETKVRIQGEIDRGVRGRYVWVQSIQLVD